MSTTKVVPASEIELWHVTEYADCEGRSTRTIGYYKGSVEEIALMLSHKGDKYYALMFTPVSFIDAKDMTPKPHRNTHMLVNLRASYYSDDSVYVKPTFKGTVFKNQVDGLRDDSVLLVLDTLAHTKQLREEALSKLTQSERELLGLG